MADDEKKRMRFNVELEAVIEVTDLEALKRAALKRIDGSIYPADSIDPETGLSEEEAERLRMEADPSEAFAIAFVCETGVDGVEMVESSMSVSPIGKDAPEPPFARLFEACACGREDCFPCDGFQVTPRTAAVLWHCLVVLTDEAYGDIRSHGDSPVDEDELWTVFDRYPRLTFREDAVWRRQAARAFDDLASDLANGDCPGELWPRCTGEEMAIHLAIEDAEAVVTDRIEVVEDLIAPLPPHRDDFDWEMCSEMLFQDHDVLQLFDNSLDGVEDPESELNRWGGTGDLRAHHWFVPFRNVVPRDGRRPFRH